MPSSDRSRRIAIVGVGGIFPGAPDLDTFWKNILNGVDSGRHVPDDRWYLSPDQAYDSDGPKPDRVYSTWGCFIENFRFDPTGLNLDQNLRDQLDPLLHLGLHAARAAFVDADRLKGTNLNRVGVILGNIALPTESTDGLCRQILGRTLIEQLVKSIPVSDERRERLMTRLTDESKCRDWHPMNRFAASLPAELIAQSLNLGGSAFTLDAACASSLYALKFACEELRSGRADAMFAGGMSRPDCQYTQMGFTQLKALSRRGRCAPLSSAADGLVVGEGAGVFVLKRLDDAITSGDHIYGVIAGIGLSNDRGANLLAPHSEGQLRAMRAAYEEAGWTPSDVDLIECHATGTPVGDGVEITSLHELWKTESHRPGQCVIGGVKSNVGHLLTGAGAAGLMKVLLSLKHKQLPPTANFVEPAAALANSNSPFRVLDRAEPWNSRNGEGHNSTRNSISPVPRRATVNAFGFGGINAHVLIEEFVEATVENDSNVQATDLDIAIVGLATEIGGGDTEVDTPTNDWGVLQSSWYQSEFFTARDSFASIKSVRLPLGKFRIPPLEMQDMLPQQQLMLKVAAAALDDANGRTDLDATLGNRTGVFIGIELDPNTSNFHLRWSVEQDAPSWIKALDLDLAPEELADWVTKLKDEASPPLTANRVMGNLGGIVASRLAREFNVGGPSFTISAKENSGLRACEIAANALRRGELDRAIVGAVDFPCDIRNRICSLRDESANGQRSAADGAVALVLKRLEDAIRDGDSIHAVIRNINDKADGTHSSHCDDGFPAVKSIGAATGLESLAANAVLIEDHLIEKPSRQYWLHNRIEGLRQVSLSGCGVDGRNLCIELTEPPESFPGQPEQQTLRRRHNQRSNPVGTQLFVIDGNTIEEIESGLEQLSRHTKSIPEQPQRSPQALYRLAWRWYGERRPDSSRKLAMTLVAKNIDELADVIRVGFNRLRNRDTSKGLDRRVYFSREPLRPVGRLAFVFPGSGNAFAGMGRELLAAFPDVLRNQDLENQRLRDQYRPDLIWNGRPTSDLLDDHKSMIFSQVALGKAICDLLKKFGITPTASIGYSLGESAALFGLAAWVDRDEMLQRMDDASLFGSDLVRPFNAAKKAWNIPAGIEVDWISGAINCSADAIRAAIGSDPSLARVFLLIVNTPTQCVVGGIRDSVERLVRKLSASFISYSAPSTVHCEILRQVEDAYRNLHLMRTIQPVTEELSGNRRPIVFYSSASGQPYDLTDDSAAAAIVAQAVDTVDFPRVIERAYADGIRLFVEIGPGSSTVRMIDEILEQQPHFAQSATPSTADPVGAFVELLAGLMAERVPMDLDYLYGSAASEIDSPPHILSAKEVETQVGRSAFQVPAPANGWIVREEVEPVAQPIPTPAMQISDQRQERPKLTESNVIVQLKEILDARVKAHESYLKISAEIQRVTADQVALLTRLSNLPAIANGTRPVETTNEVPVSSNANSAIVPMRDEPPRSLSRPECKEFAIGRIGRVLGQKFAEIDNYPTRVRLPDEPLMLVDRILEIEGEPLSMTSGRVTTEHDIHPGAWYLDGGRIPTCIAVEAGQADLFLSGWLGIDLQTRGLACYRLLDAVVTFHRELPGPGKTIHYDIRINNFFRQGQTYLFRFEFDATVDGQPLLTMREGCAGFFTDEELAGGKGVVHTALDRQPRQGKRPEFWTDLVGMDIESYDDSQLLALRHGQLEACFGASFAGLELANPMTIPGLSDRSSTGTGRSKMWLIDRVLKLDPRGGKFGLGTILGELDIHPDDWFITCHFCDDQVMPGTLMYECCMHTLRIYLLRMGWVGEHGKIVYEPIPGIRSRLKCRGQVLASTKKVWYEITLKEIGYSDSSNHETAFCIADALMYADGKPIVEITDMSVRLSGLTRSFVEKLWHRQNLRASTATVRSVQYDRRPALFDTDRITAFAIGKPSDAFGDRYQVFDADRIIARLPGPPFQFLDRIVSIRGCEPWVLKPGGEVVAQYDVPIDAWYFAANRQQRMPFAVLLETALQPCGWLAAYVGSALTSETDVSFRNLGGTATQFRDVTADAGTLTTTVKMTRVSNSGGMIIQHYDFDLRCNNEPVYVGNTYFGFFSKASLKNQIGIRDAKPFVPTPSEESRTKHIPYPDAPPFADSRLKMVDEMQLALEGGPMGKGFAIGTMTVDPTAWFFKAHFHQDPVVPGSLGLESFFQLLKAYAAYRWQLGSDAQFATPVLGGHSGATVPTHEWIYRGQVVPTDQRVTVTATIKHVDDTTRELSAEGYLSVDGRVIYQMKEFSLGCGEPLQ